jgi:excinuclease ABC subunit A
VFVRCPDCNGRRYRPHILEVKVSSSRRKEAPFSRSEAGTRSKMRKGQSLLTSAATKEWSIADLLDATVDEVIGFLSGFPDSRSANRAAEKLRLLEEVGLGYLRLGQPINTLSGGESQRLKLVSHLAESRAGVPPAHSRTWHSIPSIPTGPRAKVSADRRDACPTLFLFDEPTTGLHFDDIRVLLKAFQRLVDAGHSVLVIEHNLEVIKCADWIIDLGPEAGDEGGYIVAHGTPEDLATCPASHTGRFLREVLPGPGHAFSSGRSPDHIPPHANPLPCGEPPRL